MGQVHAFDTHKYVKELQATGFKENQAESIIRSILESRSNDVSHLATKEQVNALKEQVNALENKFDAKIDALENKFDAKIETLATKDELKSLEIKIIESQNTMIKWMIGTMFAFSGLIMAAFKFFMH